MVNPHLEDGQSFVEGRSEETARKLIEAADAAKIDRAEIFTTSDGYIVPSKLSGDFETKSASDYPAVPTEPGTDTDPNKVTNVGGTEQDADEQTRRFNEAAERQASFEPDEPTGKEATPEYDENTQPNFDENTPTVEEGGVRTANQARREANEGTDSGARDGTVTDSDGDGVPDSDEVPTPRSADSTVDAGNPATEEADQFDPSEHTVDEVWDYLEGADDAERKRVLDAERDGKNRKAFQSETEGDK